MTVPVFLCEPVAPSSEGLAFGIRLVGCESPPHPSDSLRLGPVVPILSAHERIGLVITDNPLLNGIEGE